MIKRLIFAALGWAALGAPTQAQTEYGFIQFSSLRDGMASMSLVWDLTTNSAEDARALEAVLLAKLNDGTPTKSVRDSLDFRTIAGASYSISSSPSHVIATLMAPQDFFEDAAAHFAESLRDTDVSGDWLDRFNSRLRQVPSTRIATQANVERELTEFALYASHDRAIDAPIEMILRRPDQVIANARDYNFGETPDIVMSAFPPEIHEPPKPPSAPRDLPSGVIFMEDDDANEALIFLADTIPFETHEDQALANTLYRYMGYGPGSEMFTILRQEKRASYDPQSHFTELGTRFAFMGLSANVEAAKWQDSYDTIAEIYRSARAGENSAQGLENSKNQMINVLAHGLRQEPDYLVRRYLEVFPYASPIGRLSLPMIATTFDLDTSSVNSNAARVMPPVKDMLTIIIGGHEPPPAEMQAAGYCTLEKGEPLRICLDELSK
ncbi:MAG: insulinase family protein [Pseudomonadota bacterium]